MKTNSENSTPELEYIIDGVRNAIAETHDIDASDDTYAANVVDHLIEEGVINPAPNDGDVQEALDRFIQSYKLMLNNLEIGEPKNMDGTKTFPPWLRDCRADLDKIDILNAALSRPKEQSEAVWQPIETAPMDGSALLLLEQDGDVQIGSWRKDDYSGVLTWLGDDFNEYSTGFASTPITPISWCLLPPIKQAEGE